MTAPESTSEVLDLQEIRLAGTTAAAITARPGALPAEDVTALDQATGHLFTLLEEVERLQQEVSTRETAARHALGAAARVPEEAESLRAELEQALDQRAAAYLVEVQCWDLLGRAHAYVPGPGDDGETYDSRQLNHNIGVQLEADPGAVARTLWEGLHTADAVRDAAEGVPGLPGEGSFSADEVDQAKARLLTALAAHDKARAGERDG